jgi:hypothetical protein
MDEFEAEDVTEVVQKRVETEEFFEEASSVWNFTS